MKVKDLKNMLKDLPPEMEVVMLMKDDVIITACREMSHVTTLMNDGDNEEETVLLLVPCGCNNEPEIPLGGINSQPELN